METRDFYVILGVEPGASAHVLRGAYRHLALRYRPDRDPPRSTGTFREIAEAYRVLSDPVSRASYDETLRHGLGEPPPPRRPIVARPEPLVPDPISLEHDFEAREPSVEEVMERVRRNYTGRHVPKSERLDALNLDLGIPSEVAAFGGTVHLGVPVFYPCALCAGTGHDGFGACIACDRTGLFEEEEQVPLRIPPLSHDGDVFELPLLGLGIHNLYLRVRLRVEA